MPWVVRFTVDCGLCSYRLRRRRRESGTYVWKKLQAVGCALHGPLWLMQLSPRGLYVFQYTYLYGSKLDSLKYLF